jgi:hypothetical protein
MHRESDQPIAHYSSLPQKNPSDFVMSGGLKSRTTINHKHLTGPQSLQGDFIFCTFFFNNAI